MRYSETVKILVTALLAALTGAVTVMAQPVITIEPTNQIILAGSNVTFTVAATGSGLLSYQWQFNGTNLPGDIITTVAGGGTGGDGGMATAASLNYPDGVAVDAAGDLFIAESGGNRVRKVDTNGIITTLAGNGVADFSGDGGPGTNASLNSPFDVGVDGLGNVYISDTLNNRIRKVDTNGIITTLAGNGAAAFSGDGGTATNASLSSPNGIYVDAAGDVLVADYNNQRIRRIDLSGNITTLAGNGITNLAGDGGLATAASLSYPAGVAMDTAGNVYIADYGNSRIRKVDTSGIITTVAGSLPGAPGYASGDGGPATNAVLLDCVQITVDRFANFYFDDVYHGTIREVDTNGIIWTPVTGLNNPYGLAIDQQDNLYIADAQNNRIAKVALPGLPTLTLNGVTATNAGNYDVIVADSSGSVTSSVVSLTVNVPAYILTEPQSQQVSIESNATFSVTAGGTLPLTYQWLFNGGPIPGAVNSNYTFTVTGSNEAGNYSVVVTNNYGSVTSSVVTLTVRMIPAGIAAQPASQVVPGGSNATFSVVASGSPPFSYQWFFNAVAMAGQTNATLLLSNVTTNQAGGYGVFVSNPYGSITSDVATLTVAGLPVFTAQPTNQTLLAGNRVLLVAGVTGVGPLTFQWQLNGTNLPNNLIATVAGNGTAGFAGDGGLATTGEVFAPCGVAADRAGNLFIADSSNNRIRRVNTSGLLSTIAGTGVAGFAGDNGPATSARLNTPRGVALNNTGNLFIADFPNNRIRRVDTNGIITTTAGNGGSGFTGDGVAATNTTLYWPQNMAADSAGNLFIADSENNRVRKVDTNGIITTVAGNGTAGFAGDGGMATNASLNLPRAVAPDGNGNLFIADSNNHRIRKVDAYGVITTVAGNGSSAFSGDFGMATNTGIAPYGVAVDAFGDLLIADQFNNRIRRVDPYDIITTVAGIGPGGYRGDGGPAVSAWLNAPSGVALDGYGRTLIADTSNNRIRRFGQGPVLVLDKATAANAGDYTLVVNSPFGSVTSSIVAVNLELPPIIPTFTTNGTFNFTWAAVPGLVYQLQYATNFDSPVWQNLEHPVTATNNIVSVMDVPGTNAQKFYRVQLVQ